MQHLGSRDNGILIGKVCNLEDPEKLARVKVKFPELENQESDWARLAMLMAGGDHGTFFVPEVGDEVLVAFEHGDPRRPYVIGCVWSQAQKPPATDGKPVDNNWRFIHSRSGHIIKLDDTKGEEKIEIIDKDGGHKVVIDTANKKIQVTCESGDVEVKASSGNVTIKATTVSVHATGNMDLKADGNVTIKGATVAIN
jgi:uncharacterized protein involved in type VI secretion and phage assembly